VGCLRPRRRILLLIARLPGFRSIRAPVHAWFVVALALALLAASGVAWLSRRFRYRWLPLALLAFCAVDLWYWNMGNNHLAYARQSFEDRYLSLANRFQSAAATTNNDALRRVWAPFDSPVFGPLNSMLDQRIEVTWGYNPFALARYTVYLGSAANNPRLLNGLAVTAMLNTSTGRFDPNPLALPRVSAPRAIIVAHSRAESAAGLASLDPATNAIVEGRPSRPALWGLPSAAIPRTNIGSTIRLPAPLYSASPYPTSPVGAPWSMAVRSSFFPSISHFPVWSCLPAPTSSSSAISPPGSALAPSSARFSGSPLGSGCSLRGVHSERVALELACCCVFLGD